jgi:Holliday junction resolvasome RuvABC endonuclease subunit
MKSTNYEYPLKDVVVALYPGRHGISYAVFQGAAYAVKTGVIRKTNRTHLDYLKLIEEEIVDVYFPDALVVKRIEEDNPQLHRSQILVEDIVQSAARIGIPCKRYSREDIRKAFAGKGAITKDEIAQAIAIELPEFKSCLPRPRKNFMHEHYRMQIFDAVALALTYFYEKERKDKPTEMKEEPQIYVTRKLDEHLSMNQGRGVYRSLPAETVTALKPEVLNR